MSFPCYPKYKPSGVEWLGNVPEHWEVGQSRRMFSQRKERARADDRQLTASQKYGIIYQNEFMELEGQKVVQVILGADILKHVEPGDFVISMRSFQGGIERSESAGCISSAYVMLMPKGTIDGAFFSYLLKSATYIQALQSTTNLVRDGQAMRFDNFTLVDLPIVPLEEQQLIAAFLDRETAKIDALVEEQKRLIELLREKRQGIITHAVTRGLDPDVPMKPSGIDWLEDVPEHWETRKFSRVVRVAEGQVDPQEVGFADMMLIAPNHVESGTGKLLELETAAEQAAESGKYLCRSGDVVYSKIRPALAKVVIAPCDCLCSADMYPLCGIDEMQNRYLKWVLLSKNFTAWSVLKADRVAMPKINRETLADLHLPLPPVREQERISTYIESVVAQQDDLMEKAALHVKLLEEHRSALISAAVTGKIDVRGVAAQSEAA